MFCANPGILPGILPYFTWNTGTQQEWNNSGLDATDIFFCLQISKPMEFLGKVIHRLLLLKPSAYALNYLWSPLIVACPFCHAYCTSAWTSRLRSVCFQPHSPPFGDVFPQDFQHHTSNCSLSHRNMPQQSLRSLLPTVAKILGIWSSQCFYFWPWAVFT